MCPHQNVGYGGRTAESALHLGWGRPLSPSQAGLESCLGPALCPMLLRPEHKTRAKAWGQACISVLSGAPSQDPLHPPPHQAGDTIQPAAYRTLGTHQTLTVWPHGATRPCQDEPSQCQNRPNSAPRSDTPGEREHPLCHTPPIHPELSHTHT